MTRPEPAKLRIRNERYPRWLDMLGAMSVSLAAFGAIGGFFVPRAYAWVSLLSVLVGFLGMGMLALYGLFQQWDMRRPLPGRPLAARTLFEWMVLGIRRKELGPADGWTALVPFRGLPGSRHAVHHVNFGDGFEVDNLWVIARFPVRAVTQVRFAPDPNEDYVGAEHPIHLCTAIFEVDSGRQFRLTVTESDAQRVRQWAESKGIPVCDCGGYRPRPALLAAGPDHKHEMPDRRMLG